jgi:anaerobic selenocysteine-containing dehydrogenase
MHATRDSIADIWGERADERMLEVPQQWVRRPLIRRDGSLQEASWDEAMSLIVERSKQGAPQALVVAA